MEHPPPVPTHNDSGYRQLRNQPNGTPLESSGWMAHPEQQGYYSIGNSAPWQPQPASNNSQYAPAYPSQTRESDANIDHQQPPAYPSPSTQGTGNNEYQQPPAYPSPFGQGMGNNGYQSLPAYPSSIGQGHGSGDYRQVGANPSQSTESSSSSGDQLPEYVPPARESDSSNNSQPLPLPAPPTLNLGLRARVCFCQIEDIIFLNTPVIQQNPQEPINGGPAPSEFISGIVPEWRSYQQHGPFPELVDAQMGAQYAINLNHRTKPAYGMQIFPMRTSLDGSSLTVVRGIIATGERESRLEVRIVSMP
ncbi:MAG: hypothetical protein Q9212_003547 [Teloschistes hypoglaucus]